MVYEERRRSRGEKLAMKIAGKPVSPDTVDPALLEVLTYEYPHRRVTVTLSTKEFTCVCPFSGLPDFATLTIRYIPRRKLIEMKALKYYLFAYRNVKIYNEHAVNRILEDLVSVLRPYEMELCGEFTARGGITNTVTARFGKKK